MMFSESIRMLVCLASISSPPSMLANAARDPIVRATVAQAGTITGALPQADSPFIDGADEILLKPLTVPSNDRSAGRVAEPTGPRRESWFRRTVSDWLVAGNRSESAPSFFARLREQQRVPGDALLVSRCRSLLLADPTLRGLFIHVSCDDSVLRLRGNVPTEQAKAQAEVVARRTSGVSSVRNDLVVTSASIQQATFVGASLSVPQRLDGNNIQSALPPALPDPGPAAPVVSPPAAQPVLGAVLGQTIEPIPASGLPEVKSYVIRRPGSSAAPSMMAMPPVQHQTMEQQQVAKAPVQATILPSGRRWGDGQTVRAPIPAPPARSGGIPVVPAAVAAPSAGAPVANADPWTQQTSRDITAILRDDPRAKSLVHVIRGREVRLSGSVRLPEEIYAISQLISELPGVDFVSIDDVQFSN